MNLRLLLASFLFALPLVAQQPAPTTVILVRHAEKAATPADDPPLTAAGEARARTLLAIARDAGVTAIITTQLVRTRETAQPTADALHITPDVAHVGGPQHAAEVTQMIRAHPGGVVLVVSHGNTIPLILAALGAAAPAPICESEYDRLYVLTLMPTGPPRVIQARYGEPSKVTAGCGGMTR